MEYDDVLSWYAGAMAELDAAVHEPSGAAGGLYDNSLFEVSQGHVLVYRPTPQPPCRGWPRAERRRVDRHPARAEPLESDAERVPSA